ncbi:MAG: hypothetical protein K9L61_03455 [Candidatus Omnitrophica bacterium]|nr:hypothetical protein [Candidatus Omnitrophota bacterium]
MKYQQEQDKARIRNISHSLKMLAIKIASILITVALILALIFSINFFRHVVLGKSSMSEFKNNFFGIPTDKLLQINQEISNQYEALKKWFNNFKTRLSS